MGARGPGAKTKPKPPKLPTGRPRTSIALEIHEALREPTLEAIVVLRDLLKSDDERTQLLAAKALVELGSRPPPPAEPDPDVKPEPMVVTVKRVQDYRASTG